MPLSLIDHPVLKVNDSQGLVIRYHI